jgi:MEMO1 family protein
MVSDDSHRGWLAPAKFTSAASSGASHGGERAMDREHPRAPAIHNVSMATPLPRLRTNLDFMPSPVPDRPGLLIRDPFHYSDTTLIVPPVLVECLQFFDGEQTELDLREALVRLTGDLSSGDIERQLRNTLSEAGFFEDETYERLRDRQHTVFAQAEWRAPAHAGSAYPIEPGELKATLAAYLASAGPSAARSDLLGIAAPHVSPDGGAHCYGAAYNALSPAYKDRVFVILGTSHYGEADRFGLTRKSFVTPLGAATTAKDLVDELAASGGPAVKLEDYSHAVEHSIEFQIVFLQHVYGPDIRVLPILCGPFSRSGRGKTMPDEDEQTGRFLSALGGLASREGQKLFWVLGIDMAHMGRRYGDPLSMRADSGPMVEVAARDRERIARIEAGDAAGLWTANQGHQDALKWCGTTPLYTFMKAVPGARADLLRYEQWNIDDHSVVSFGALAFHR